MVGMQSYQYSISGSIARKLYTVTLHGEVMSIEDPPRMDLPTHNGDRFPADRRSRNWLRLGGVCREPLR